MNKKLNLLLLLSGVLFTLVGCESEDVTSTKIETPAFSGTLTNQFSTNSSVLNRNGFSPDLSSNTSHGISVSGQGSKMVEPDLALLNVGVEVFAETVTLARNTAAKSLRAMCIGMSTREKNLTASYLLRKLSLSKKVPFLLIWGDKDNFTPLFLGKKIANFHRWVKLKIISNSGHCIHDEDPSIFNKISYKWIRDLKTF